MENEPNYFGMQPGDMLAAVGDDAHKWASAFMQTLRVIGPEKVDHALMVGWFANAIEHSGDVRRWRAEKAE